MAKNKNKKLASAAKPVAGGDNDAVILQLNRLLEIELSGVARYLHYSFMIFGPTRIPIVKWFREQALEGGTIVHMVVSDALFPMAAESSR